MSSYIFMEIHIVCSMVGFGGGEMCSFPFLPWIKYIYKEEGEVMNQTLDQKITSMWAKNLTRYYMLPPGPAL